MRTKALRSNRSDPCKVLNESFLISWNCHSELAAVSIYTADGTKFSWLLRFSYFLCLFHMGHWYEIRLKRIFIIFHYEMLNRKIGKSLWIFLYISLLVLMLTLCGCMQHLEELDGRPLLIIPDNSELFFCLPPVHLSVFFSFCQSRSRNFRIQSRRRSY